MHLLIGLGNPGTKYEHTRHNVGFDIVEIVSQKTGIPIQKKLCRALVGEGAWRGERVALCKPQTYMNLSGEAVSALMHWYKVTPEETMIFFDDVDLPSGVLRVRASGSAGTHNGMRSIVQCTGSTAFPRVRVGIGGKPDYFDLADWVLAKYNTAEERKEAFDAYMRAADAALCYVTDGIQTAMQRFNPARVKKPADPPAPDTNGERNSAE